MNNLKPIIISISLIIVLGLFTPFFPFAGESITSLETKDSTVSKTVYLGAVKIDKEEISFVHKNYLGSPVVETDIFGGIKTLTNYLPYGESNSPAGKDYTGKIKTSIGTVNLGAREYSPEISRFTIPDPIIYDTTSPYNYANNNPYKYVDPTGEAAFLIALAAAYAFAEMASDAYDLAHATNDQIEDPSVENSAKVTLTGGILLIPGATNLWGKAWRWGKGLKGSLVKRFARNGDEVAEATLKVIPGRQVGHALDTPHDPMSFGGTGRGLAQSFEDATQANDLQIKRIFSSDKKVGGVREISTSAENLVFNDEAKIAVRRLTEPVRVEGALFENGFNGRSPLKLIAENVPDTLRETLKRDGYEAIEGTNNMVKRFHMDTD